MTTQDTKLLAAHVLPLPTDRVDQFAERIDRSHGRRLKQALQVNT